MPRYAILVPVLDDWESLGHLIEEIDRATLAFDHALELIVVDDGSSAPPPRYAWLPGAGESRVERIDILRLALNLGHQRAVAVGLAALAKRTDLDGVIVMDGDGEDRPDDIPR